MKMCLQAKESDAKAVKTNVYEDVFKAIKDEQDRMSRDMDEMEKILDLKD